jgi:trigger factor
MEYPPVVVERDINRLFNQQLQYLQASGVNVETYLKALNKTAAQIREELRPRSENRVKQSLILEELGKQEKIEVSDADVDAEIESILGTTAEAQKEEARTELNASRDSIKEMLLVRKALQRLVEIAKNSYTESKDKDKEKEGKNEQPTV